MNFKSFENFVAEVRDSVNEYFTIDNDGDILEIRNYPEYLRIELLINGQFMVYDLTYASKPDQENEFFDYGVYNADGIEILVEHPFIENEILNFINKTDEELFYFAIE